MRKNAQSDQSCRLGTQAESVLTELAEVGRGRRRRIGSAAEDANIARSELVNLVSNMCQSDFTFLHVLASQIQSLWSLADQVFKRFQRRLEAVGWLGLEPRTNALKRDSSARGATNAWARSHYLTRKVLVELLC